MFTLTLSYLPVISRVLPSPQPVPCLLVWVVLFGFGFCLLTMGLISVIHKHMPQTFL